MEVTSLHLARNNLTAANEQLYSSPPTSLHYIQATDGATKKTDIDDSSKKTANHLFVEHYIYIYIGAESIISFSGRSLINL
jgi:hypothetical protein